MKRKRSLTYYHDGIVVCTVCTKRLRVNVSPALVVQ